MDIFISIFGAVTAIIVAVIGAVLSNNNNNIIQLRKLKEQHYVAYIESLHNYASENDNPNFKNSYTFNRDKLFIMQVRKL